MEINELWLENKCIEKKRVFITGKKERLTLLFSYQFGGDYFNPSIFLELRKLYLDHYGEFLKYPSDNRLDANMFSMIDIIRKRAVSKYIDEKLL